MSGLPMLKKVRWYVQPFRYYIETWQTDGQTDRQNSYIKSFYLRQRQVHLIWDSNPNFRIDPDPVLRRIAGKMLWIYSLAGISHLLSFVKSDVKRTGSSPKFNRFFPMAGAIVTPSTKLADYVCSNADRQTDRKTDCCYLAIYIIMYRSRYYSSATE